MKPLLLIDVDGPLNPDRTSSGRRKGYTRHRMSPTGWSGIVYLNHDHGARLAELPYELVWCTTWEHEANEWIGPHIGLPKLPVIEFDKTWHQPTRPDGTYFKTWDVVKYAAGRPFAWIDDEIHRIDVNYVANHHTGPALLHRVSPRDGLLDRDFDTLRKWAEGITS
jgi:hypothetical protein